VFVQAPATGSVILLFQAVDFLSLRPAASDPLLAFFGTRQARRRPLRHRTRGYAFFTRTPRRRLFLHGFRPFRGGRKDVLAFRTADLSAQESIGHANGFRTFRTGGDERHMYLAVTGHRARKSKIKITANSAPNVRPAAAADRAWRVWSRPRGSTE